MTKLLSYAIGLLSLLLSFGVVEAKEVVIPYDDFLKMVSMKEHSDNTTNQKAAENAVLVKLKDEHETIIKVQAEQIANCAEIVKTHEQLGATQEEIDKAVQGELMQVKRELEKEKRLSRYKSETVWIMLGGLALWAIN